MTTEQQREETMEQELEEKSEVTETEQVGEPIPEAETKTVQEQLAEQVKACIVETRSCEDLGTKFDKVATELGIGVDDLIEQVFEIIARREGEPCL